MRIRIIIDTQDAEEAPDAPFTLNVYKDDDDGTPSGNPLGIGEEDSCLIGYGIPDLLYRLAQHWNLAEVYDQDGEAMPRTGAEWVQQVRREEDEDN